MSDGDDDAVPSTLDRVLDHDDGEGMGVSEAFTAGLAGVVLAAFGAVILVAETIGQGIANVIARLEALGRFIQAFFDNPILILESAARDTAAWIIATDLGPFGFAVGVFSIAIAWWAWAVFRGPTPFFGRFLDRFR